MRILDHEVAVGIATRLAPLYGTGGSPRGGQVEAMEATSDYWKPVSYLIEDVSECWLLNSHHLKAMPGRKTDVNNSEWIAQLVEHGLGPPVVRGTAADR